MGSLSWMEEAACAGKADIFFPETGDKGGGNLNPARRICDECPVSAQCLAYGLELADPNKTVCIVSRGIWGGYSSDELRDMVNSSRREMSDHECEHINCTATTPWNNRHTAPAHYCSIRCCKAEAAYKSNLRYRAKVG